MRRVDRDAAPGPASLLTPGRTGQTELDRAITHHGPPRNPGVFTFRAYKGDDVRHALENLFYGKCAYCESRYDVSGPVDIEHYRPKGKVDGAKGHPGYWWLAAEWTNLLPSCLDCNRRRYQPTPDSFFSLSGALEASRGSGFIPLATGKESCFPIAATGVRVTTRPEPAQAAAALEAEHALLLNPCSDKPDEHLVFFIDRLKPLGIVYPAKMGSTIAPVLPIASQEVAEIEAAAREAGVSVKAAISIQTYGLNRLALVQERTRLLRKLEFLGSVATELFAIADGLGRIDVAGGDLNIRDEAIVRARATAHRVLAEIRSLAMPDAPFSAMVKAWVEVFKENLRRRRPGMSQDAQRQDGP
ncbi:hypothetical protein ACC755_09800 [Rhizobium ruizarguesonis]|uniref:endonuclease n=1 Tax=Rhizobium ruizarguesonis TaxID=2081791 RepID=UPI001030827E|nr:endonuclease [Rhizobium ruizarguesonis]TAY84525.1 endonuclease [Rhizobium ruizarguesonis]